MITASSAARNGATANAVIASAPMAAAQSERRLNRLRDMRFPLGLGGLDGSLGRGPGLAIGAGLSNVPRYAAARALLPPDAHEFVNKTSELVRSKSRRLGEIGKPSEPAFNDPPPPSGDKTFIRR